MSPEHLWGTQPGRGRLGAIRQLSQDQVYRVANSSWGPLNPPLRPSAVLDVDTSWGRFDVPGVRTVYAGATPGVTLAIQLGSAPVRFLGDLASGAFTVEPVAAADWLRIAELVVRYCDLPLGTVDASVVAAAERLGVTDITTIDRGHFTVVRPSHVEALNIAP